MNAPLNISAEIDRAAAAGDVAILADLARQLLATTFTATKPKPVKRSAGDAYLTTTERRAIGLPDYKDGKIGGGAYRYVLVTFAGGFKSLTGYYPRAKNPDDLTPAIVSARARYLLILSGGRLLDARLSNRVPAILSARIVATPAAIKRERAACLRLRVAFEVLQSNKRQLARAWQHRHAPGIDRSHLRSHVRAWLARCRVHRGALAAQLDGRAS